MEKRSFEEEYQLSCQRAVEILEEYLGKQLSPLELAEIRQRGLEKLPQLDIETEKGFLKEVDPKHIHAAAVTLHGRGHRTGFLFIAAGIGHIGYIKDILAALPPQVLTQTNFWRQNFLHQMVDCRQNLAAIKDVLPLLPWEMFWAKDNKENTVIDLSRKYGTYEYLPAPVRAWQEHYERAGLLGKMGMILSYWMGGGKNYTPPPSHHIPKQSSALR